MVNSHGNDKCAANAYSWERFSGDVTKRHDGREHHDAEIYSTVKEIKTRLWPTFSLLSI